MSNDYELKNRHYLGPRQLSMVVKVRLQPNALPLRSSIFLLDSLCLALAFLPSRQLRWRAIIKVLVAVSCCLIKRRHQLFLVLFYGGRSIAPTRVGLCVWFLFLCRGLWGSGGRRNHVKQPARMGGSRSASIHTLHPFHLTEVSGAFLRVRGFPGGSRCSCSCCCSDSSSKRSIVITSSRPGAFAQRKPRRGRNRHVSVVWRVERNGCTCV